MSSKVFVASFSVVLCIPCILLNSTYFAEFCGKMRNYARDRGRSWEIAGDRGRLWEIDEPAAAPTRSGGLEYSRARSASLVKRRGRAGRRRALRDTALLVANLKPRANLG